MTLPRGLYDQLITTALAGRLDRQHASSAALDDLGSGEATPLLVDLLRQSLAGVLEDLHTRGGESLLQQLEIVNALLVELRSHVTHRQPELVDHVPSPVRRLRAVHAPGTVAPQLPVMGLAEPWLFTAAKQSPSLLEELRRECAECDQIDILVSFITISGVRKLLDTLKTITAGDAQGNARTKVRVLTTTYTGATELAALMQLAALNGCTIRISLDGRRTRLHAKAWIFHRRTGFGSAYVGSANFSGAALIGGLEWTVKFTEHNQRSLYQRAQAHFDTLWADEEFQSFDHTSDTSCAAVRAALKRESNAYDPADTTPHYFDITAKRYQADILEQLQYEREHGRTRNLLVAATGTGKTVMAALDYRHMVNAHSGRRPRLLFVAHREEILKQALWTYRAVLRDHSFGELLKGGSNPAQHDYLFATIQSITSRNLVETFGADHWHTIVIDECHRIAAAGFDLFARAIRPAILLGLTATPERTDGQSLQPYFDARADGSPAAELRLWHALDLELLAPFEYFGCNDDTDFSNVPWGRSGEVEAIDKLVTGNQVRARMILDEWNRLVGSAARSKALVFCVSVAHARFMHTAFTKAGLRTSCLTGDSSTEERNRAPRDLADGTISAIITVDLYNEGVDLPDVDTLLFLRPTQSPLLFQQQLGRGLRLKEGKTSCLVLDFVGQHRADFRFDRLLASITGLNRRELLRGVEEGFSTLPSGCHVQLEPQARAQVLKSLRGAVNQSWKNLKTEVQSYAASARTRSFTLAAFVRDTGVGIDEIYRDSRTSGWTTLRREAGLLGAHANSEHEADFSRSLRYLLHVNDPAQLTVMRRVAEGGATYRAGSDDEALRAQMLTYQMEIKTAQPYSAFAKKLAAEPHVLRELGELTDLLESQTRVTSHRVPGLEDTPLTLHGRYQIRELLTAFKWLNATKRPPFQAGVLPLKDRRLELLFVTLDKSEGYHDRIAYHDYAVSPTQFHWQTQNSAGPDTLAGRRYTQSLSNGWTFQLFVRGTKGTAYAACGPVTIRTPDDITGNRPMSITWTLSAPLPITLFREFSVLRAA